MTSRIVRGFAAYAGHGNHGEGEGEGMWPSYMRQAEQEAASNRKQLFGMLRFRFRGLPVQDAAKFMFTLSAGLNMDSTLQSPILKTRFSIEFRT